MLGRQDGRTDGVAGHYAARPAVKVRLRVGVCQHHAVDVLTEHLVGHAGIGVLLMDDGGDPELYRRHTHRSRNIAARTDADIGVELPDDLLRRRAGGERPLDGRDIMGDILRRQRTLEAGDHHGTDLKARTPDQPLFHTVAVADEQDLSVGLLLFDKSR